MTVDLAVLLTCFNRRETTLRCLAGVHAQRGLDDVTLSVIVVDDGGDDGTSAAIAREFPEVIVVQGDGSLYWTGGMRRADEVGSRTRPDFLLWLNDDVDLKPDAVRELLDAADATMRRSLIVGTVRDPDTGRASYGGYLQTDKRRPLRMLRVEPNGSLQPVHTMNGNVVLVPREVRVAVGPLDAGLPHNMADMEYAFRARRAGWEVNVSPSFVGSCAANRDKARWVDPAFPLRERVRALTSPKGLPPRAWLQFTRRHCGWRWPRYFAGPYVRSIVCRIAPTGDLGGRSGATGEVRVVHVLNELKRSGAEVMLLNAANDFRNAGVRSSVMSLGGASEDAVVDLFTRAGYPVVQAGQRPSLLRFLRSYHRELRLLHPQCVHVHPERRSLLTCLMPRLMGMDVVRTIHNNFGFEGVLWARKTLERQILRVARVQTVAVSPSVQANERNRFRNPTTLVFNWYDDGRFVPPSAAMKQSAREAFAIPANRRVVAVIGNCSHVKNHGLLLDAMALIPAAHRPILLHVGNGDTCVDERQQCEDIGISDDVMFLGSLDDVLPVLLAADQFVMPSLYEGMSIAALEALASGLPLRVAPVAGLLDLVALFDTVQAVALDPKSWAVSLEAVTQTPELAGPSGDQTERTRQLFGIARGVDQYVRLYRQSAHRTRARRDSAMGTVFR